jgi:hypothetical protein
MVPATKKRRRNSPYGCADAVSSLLDTLVTNEAAAEQPDTAATTGTASTTRPIVLTPSAVQAMMICHERFLQILAAELAVGAEEGASAKSTASTASNTANTAAASSGLSVVQTTHVMSALQQLGWEELAPPVLSSKKAKQTRQQRPPVSSSGPKRGGKGKSKKRKKEWTSEELEAQERLLAASKEKLKGQTET